MKITKGRKAAPVRAVLYGTEGIGKTTLAAQWPTPLFLDTEGGTHQLEVDRVDCGDWIALEGALLSLAGDRQGYQSVVIDSADWAERMLIDALLQKAGKRSIEDFGYGKGYTMVAERFAKLLEMADSCITAGLNVLFVGHAITKRCSPPDQDDGYDRFELKLTKQSAPLLKEWADLLLFCNYRTQLVEGADGRKKGRGGKERFMYAERDAAWDAKNRFGLPAEMPMGFEPLAGIFAAGFDQALVATIEKTIANAKSVQQLGKGGDRIDELVSESKLDADTWSRLTDLINARDAELQEPAATE